MREILFRGKRIDNDEWVEGGVVQGVVHELWRNSDRAYITVFPEFLSRLKLEEVDPNTVGQYTGLCDKNGKKIFEGDILAHWNEDQNRYVAKCVAEYGEFNCTCCDGIYGWYFDGGDIRFVSDDNNYYEVIGNIHDNPELLEVDNG